MKTFSYKAGVLILITSLVTACVGDLDVKPIDPNVTTADKVYKTPADYKKGLAKLYATFALSGQQGPSGQPDIAGIDEGFGNYLRQYWNCQELTTDEAVIAWNDATIKDFHYHTWTPSDVFIGAVYSRILYTVALCNEFIRVTQKSDDEDVATMRAEARFLRALAYYHALDLFGNPPFITEDDLPGSTLPDQTDRASLFAYIEQELIDIEDLLGDPQFEYGRADKGACWMLQAKLYLNAEVYIEEARYTDAITALNKVVAGPYSIAANYLHNFVADNHTSPELIFAINYDEVNTQSYGGMVYLIHAPVGGTMPAASMFGVNGGWGGIRTTSALVSKFPVPDEDTDSRALFWEDGQTLAIADVGTFTDGYSIAKFRNRNLDGSQATGSAPGDFVNTDYPMFRLADGYLMYAEAVLRGGSGGDATTALGYVNELRNRTGDAPAVPGNITAGQLTLDFVLDERARELYWEGHRRTDLIRYGKFTGGSYVWPWKGNVAEGTSTPAHLNLFPIPAADRGANPKLEQNDGY